MPAGLQPTAAEIHAISGALALNLKKALDGIKSFKVYLDATDLEAAPISMSSADEATIVSAFADLDQLRQVFDGTHVVTAGGSPGTGTVAAGNGKLFNAFAKLLWGTGL